MVEILHHWRFAATGRMAGSELFADDPRKALPLVNYYFGKSWRSLSPCYPALDCALAYSNSLFMYAELIGVRFSKIVVYVGEVERDSITFRHGVDSVKIAQAVARDDCRYGSGRKALDVDP